jgi:hypothetical protein
LGRCVFITGPNAGISRQIKTYLGQGSAASYAQAVTNDNPYIWLPLNGSAADSSGHAFSGTVHGTVTFGQTSLMAGDSGTAAAFDGSTGFITVPAPKPTNWHQGLTFEFWYKLTAANPNQPAGIYDTNPGGGTLPKNLVFGYSGTDQPPGVMWSPDKPYIGLQSPGANTVQHVVCVYNGAQSLTVYINGTLWDSETAPGSGTFNWINPFHVGHAHTGAGNLWFAGTLQHFAVYTYPMSPNQVATHYAAGTSAVGTNNVGKFVMLHPFPYTPNVGDQFTAWPGCDKAYVTCQNTFNNTLNFGGQKDMPQPETGI